MGVASVQFSLLAPFALQERLSAFGKSKDKTPKQ